MASIHELDPAVLDLSIDRAVQAVFRTMIGKPARLVPSQMDPSNHTVILDQIHVVGTIGVVGEVSGLIYLYFALPFAEYCAIRLLGLSASKVQNSGPGLVNDVVGELTNMTFGVFKNQLAELGFPCRLTLPSVRRGNKFTIDPVDSATRHIYRFDLAGHHLMADLMLGTGV
jgi:chemotaxis protein CheX